MGLGGGFSRRGGLEERRDVSLLGRGLVAGAWRVVADEVLAVGVDMVVDL